METARKEHAASLENTTVLVLLLTLSLANLRLYTYRREVIKHLSWRPAGTLFVITAKRALTGVGGTETVRRV